MKACVLGAGSWGTALGAVLAWNGWDVTIWARRAEVVEDVNAHHRNERYLPGAALPTGLRAVRDAEEALAGCHLLVVAVPSAAVAATLPLLRKLDDRVLVVHAVKGFVRPDNLRVSAWLEREVCGIERRLAVISGPSHAEEVVRQMPTTVVAASASRHVAERVQDAFMTDRFRVYTQADVIGVELGGALKNIIALGAGLAEGLGLGDNTRAALMTRGLAEITRLGVALGASPLTFSGLAGIGDLIVTCTSEHSRNHRAGRLLAKGLPLPEVLDTIGMAVEGVNATFAAKQLAEACGVEMPITHAIARVLMGEISPSEGIELLMTRDKNHEMEVIGAQPLTAEFRLP
ncbi:NAD(P)-dependent glycerol-3-phosphate dehydrogenase [Alicyclobacillus mali]|uniref:Glycerol-3-phosphate dehydrogenase [NAD(P)+] n=1 Tax=Alicyclobacillus mali (ex Roth et al. 2021) TaxID=1123961 RepID=A0ABS0EZD9_9BACL|nr:NAD(P)H-dependent glycerol-3-phosphate dehydrogenase [Alicyclobacillus mali (ex Roth et al. 2021)]MBF8376397.1 NAD(P)-dependent glycerol-3-phosphate dehydrogenase [Alicyclobacillus mali (ex Roth et al. 2021)]MCL6488911.1 NAD(P)-dependent glycerol-3-phosphate dehydrogenase [Alicyclobacillus mali (ex Roth et al. 2021)]